MPKPELGITGDRSTESVWGIWYDCDTYNDCLIGHIADRERVIELAGMVWAEDPDTHPRNVRLVNTVTVTDVSTVVTELTREDIDYAKFIGKKAD